MKLLRLSPAVFLLMLACGGPDREARAALTAQATSCPAAEMEVQGEADYSWEALCGGKRYYCAAAQEGGACREERPPTAAAPASAAPNMRQQISSGFLGCPPDEVVLSEEMPKEWTGRCRGAKVVCRSEGATLNCK